MALSRTTKGIATREHRGSGQEPARAGEDRSPWPPVLKALSSVAASEDATCFVGGDGLHVVYNDRFASLLSLPPCPGEALDVDGLFGEHLEAIARVISQVRASRQALGCPLYGETRGYGADDPLVVRGQPIAIAPDEPVGVQLVLSRLGSSSDAPRRDALLVWRLDERGGEIEYCSEGASRLYGFAAAEVVGVGQQPLLHTRLSCQRPALAKLLHERRQWSGGLRRRHRDGRTLWLRTTMVPLLGPDGTLRVIETTHDVSAEWDARRRARLGLPSSDEEKTALAQELRSMEALQDLGRRYVRGVSLEKLLPHLAHTAAMLTGAAVASVVKVATFSDDDSPVWSHTRGREFHRCGVALEAEAGRLAAAIPPQVEIDLEGVEGDHPLRSSALLPALRRVRLRRAMWLPLRLDDGSVWAHLWLFSRTVSPQAARARHWLDQMTRQTSRIFARMRDEAALHRSEAKLQDAIEHAAIGFAILSPSGRLVGTNHALTELLGHDADELDGVEELSLVHPEDRAAQIRAMRKQSARGVGSFTVENRYVTKHQLALWVRKSISVVRGDDGTARWYIVLVEDISRRMQAETSLQVAHDRLRELNRRKDDFIRMLSHELRNPLASLGNGVEILARVPRDSEVARRAIEAMQRQMSTLRRIVDDLLDIARIESGRFALRLEEVDLYDLLRELCEDHQPDFARAGVTLRLVTPAAGVHVRGDRTRLTQVVGNLLHNARKFTPSGGRVEVFLTREPRGSTATHAAVRVRDTGRGIDDAFRERVFEPFAQLDPLPDQRAAGLGLGLPIARALTELHHGTLHVERTDARHGTCFLLTLPEVEPLSQRAAPSQAAGHSSDKVLIIEDNDDARELLQTLVGLSGREVRAARDGEEGVRLAREHAPDVILCDIGLPGLDGYGVVRQLKAVPGLRDCRMVAVTGYANPEDVARGEAAGFDAHLAKPPALATLEPLLRSKKHDRV